jgi:hypothetical protein
LGHELHSCILPSGQKAHILRPGEYLDFVVSAAQSCHDIAGTFFIEPRLNRLVFRRSIVLQHNENAGWTAILQIALDRCDLQTRALVETSIRIAGKTGRQKKNEQKEKKEKPAEDPCSFHQSW